jgi:hypothetical protein
LVIVPAKPAEIAASRIARVKNVRCIIFQAYRVSIL